LGSFFSTLRAAAAVLLLATACGDDERPNVLLYVADTVRADELACYGNDAIQTPNFDRLADEGILFENAYAQSSWTRTSMASLLTATYPEVHGVEARMDPLSEQLRFLPEILSEAGYSTAAITSNPNIGSAFGFDRGFDDFFELYERRNPGRVRIGEFVTTADEISEVAIEWIDRASEPFFLLILSVDPHSPYEPPDGFDNFGGDYEGPATGASAFINRSDLTRAEQERIRSLYRGEITFNDHAFGMLVDDLKARGLYDRTAVIFASDHGEEFWEHGGRGHGKTLFEEVLRVPLILRLPGGFPAGKRVAAPVELVDVLPTILELCALPMPPQLQGTSLLASPDPDRPIRSRLVLDGAELEAVRLGDRKLIQSPGGTTLFFDLEKDPREQDALPAELGSHQRALQQSIDQSHRASGALRATLGGLEKPAPVQPAELSAEVTRQLERLGYLEAKKGDD